MGIFDHLLPQPTNAPQPQQPGIFDHLVTQAAPQEQQQPVDFEGRFIGDESTAAPNPKLKADLQRIARERTTGPRRSGPLEGMAIDYMNQGLAAAQRTTPNVDYQYKNLISADVYENDAGQLLYRDEAGQMLPVDRNRHNILRDPTDQRLKVFRRTEDTDEGVLSAAGRMLITGMGAGAPTARPGLGLPSAGGPRAAATTVPRASEIMATAKPSYQAFKAEAGAIDVPTETAVSIANRIRSALDNANLSPELAKPVFAVADIMEKRGAITLNALQNYKRAIGRNFNSPDKNIRDAAGVASRELSSILAEASPTAAQSLKTGDAIHSTALAVQELQRKGEIAGLRTGRAGYGGNAVNNMRQVLSPIVQKAIEGKKTLYQPNEIAAMRELVEGTTAINLARGIGQASPSKGFGWTTAATIGSFAVNPAIIAVPAIGAASNRLATVMTGNQLKRLQELVAKRSPAYAEAVAKATARYERAQSEFASNPSSARLAAYVQASRALSSGLTRDGIQISSGDLLRSIQGPMRSAAEDEQQ